MKRLLIILVLAGVIGTGLVLHARQASANGSMTVRVTLRDYAIALAQRHVPTGKPIKFVVTNRGRQTHELVLEPANAVDKALKVGGTTYEADQIKPGTTRTVVWTIPRSGSYKLACHIDHHYQKGMKTMVMATGL